MQRLVRNAAVLSKAKLFVNIQKAAFSALPSHKVVPMPALSPTMEVGSISRWLLKEGDRFEPGSAICEVETDKATVSFDATDEGYIAKILVGAGEVKVGQPLMITVDESTDVAPFANYQVTAASSAPPAPAAPKTEPPKPAAAPVIATPASTTSAASAPARAAGDRVVASPFARKLAREGGVDLASIKTGSGPNGRIVAEDVMRAAAMPKQAATAPAAPQAAAARPAPAAAQVSAAGVFSDFVLSEQAQSLAARHTAAKQVVPHYYLSVELNLSSVLRLRDSLNKQLSAGKKGKEDDSTGLLSVQDFLVKAAALAMKQVPDVNASWCDTFIRRYQQVDVNLVMGAGEYIATPVIRDVGAKGLSTLSTEIAGFEDSLGTDTSNSSAMDVGTFSIHNLGIYGVKSAAPIVLTPQACALSLGAIVDTVIPKQVAAEGGDNWEVAPVLTATLSCDHRVVDGAVGAQWLSAYKGYVENPTTMLL